jgi:hypothetical protein
MVKLVENEDHVRAMAQAALDDAAGAGWERVTTLEYEIAGRLADVEELRQRIVSVDRARAARFDEHSEQLIAAFARLGSEADGGRAFTQPMRADLLQPRMGLGFLGSPADTDEGSTDGLRQSRPDRTARLARLPGHDELRQAREPAVDA